jgi:hypothetical protein
MKEIGYSNRMTDRPAKDASTSKQDATTGNTKSWNSWQRCIALAKYQQEHQQAAMDYAQTTVQTGMDYTKTAIEYVQKYGVPTLKYILTYGSLATATLATGGLLMMRQDKPTTDLSMVYGHNSMLSQRDTLPYPSEFTGIAIPDSWRQYQNIEHDEFSQRQVSNGEWHQPTTTDIERLQDHEFQRAACQNPEYVAAAHNILCSMFQDKDCITALRNLCRDPNFKDTFADLVTDEKFIDSIRPLFSKDLQRVLEAKPEEARSHNLDTTTQESFKSKRQKGVGRRLLRDIDNNPDSTAKSDEKCKQGSQAECYWSTGLLGVALCIVTYGYIMKSRELKDAVQEKHDMETKYLTDIANARRRESMILTDELARKNQQSYDLQNALIPRLPDPNAIRRLVQKPGQPPQQPGQLKELSPQQPGQLKELPPQQPGQQSGGKRSQPQRRSRPQLPPKPPEMK